MREKIPIMPLVVLSVHALGASVILVKQPLWQLLHSSSSIWVETENSYREYKKVGQRTVGLGRSIWQRGVQTGVRPTLEYASLVLMYGPSSMRQSMLAEEESVSFLPFR